MCLFVLKGFSSVAIHLNLHVAHLVLSPANSLQLHAIADKNIKYMSKIPNAFGCVGSTFDHVLIRAHHCVSQTGLVVVLAAYWFPVTLRLTSQTGDARRGGVLSKVGSLKSGITTQNQLSAPKLPSLRPFISTSCLALQTVDADTHTPSTWPRSPSPQC